MEKSVTVLLYVLVFIVLLHACFAEEIFSDYIAEEGTATIDYEVYTAYEYNDYTGVRLSSNTYGSIIIETEGESTTKGPYTFTLDEIKQEGNDISFKITVEKESGSVSISREASATSATLGETIDMTVTITNEGSDNVKIIYKEDLPSTVSLDGTPEITKGTSTSTQKSTIADVYWSGVLYEGESATITYSFSIDRYPSTGTSITLDDIEFTYQDDTGTYPESVDAITISLSDPLTISFSSDSDEIQINDEVRYTVTLSNNLANNIEITSFALTLPDITVTSMDSQLKQSGNTYTWSGELNPFQEVYFTYYVTPKYPGTYTFSASADYDYNGEQTATETTAFSIDASDIVAEILLSSTSFDGGEPIIINYYVNNSDESISYSNVNIKISSSLFDTLNYVTALPAKQKILIKKQNFTAPYTNTEMEYETTLTGDLGNGDTFESSETITINPTEFTAPYAVAYTINGIDEENTNITMTLTLLTTLAQQPSRLAVVHSAEDYKKTISLTAEQITELFTTQSYTRSWNIPTLSFTEDSVEMDAQLQYIDNSGTYYKTLDSVEIPVYQEFVPEPTINETVNETITDTNDEPTNETTEIPTEEITESETPSVIISGEKEETSKKWGWFIVILAALAGFSFAVVFILKKKEKSAEIKKNIAQISGKQEQKKENIFERAKDMIIHDIPKPDEGYEKLEEFIKHSINQGKTKEEVKKILAAKGWIEDVLEIYLRQIK